MTNDSLKVTLKTATGHLVHEAELPPFKEYPQVVIWGDRVFQLNPKEVGGKYYECFFYIVVDLQPMD